MGTKEVPLLSNTLLLDAEVGAINCHQTIVFNVIDETALEVYLWFFRQRSMQRGETMAERMQ